MSTCEKHKSNIDGWTLEDLAEAIGDLRYDRLTEFLMLLSRKLSKDSSKDRNGGRIKLAVSLKMASNNVFYAANEIATSWKISRPFMKL